MNHLLHPQLPVSVANSMARALGGLPIADLEARAALQHDKATFSATGGARVSAFQLKELVGRVRELKSAESVFHFDAALGRLLHQEMRLSRGEASLEGVWAFLGCVAMPDIVRWRFASESETPIERFVGGSRGVRSVFGRCWWRGELLFDDKKDSDPYWLLRELGEDELTGIIDRQRAIVSRRVAVALARALVEMPRGELPRATLARDVFKRYLRFSAFMCFETLRSEELAIACSAMCQRSLMALTRPSETS